MTLGTDADVAFGVDMFLNDFLTAGVTGTGAVPVTPDVIGGERTVVIHAGFAVGDHVALLKGFWPAGIEDAGEDLVLFDVVVIWFGNGTRLAGTWVRHMRKQ